MFVPNEGAEFLKNKHSLFDVKAIMFVEVLL